MAIDKTLLAGSTATLILKLLDTKDMYGYQMVSELSRRSDNTFQLKEGTLYPLLHTLEKQGWVRSYTKQTPSGRERKYYRLTDDGRAQLEYKEKEWQLFSTKVNAVLGFSAG